MRDWVDGFVVDGASLLSNECFVGGLEDGRDFQVAYRDADP